MAATRQRRAYGTHSVVDLGDGRFRLFVWAPDGKRPSRVFEAANATEANKAAGPLASDLLAEHEAVRSAAGQERATRQTWTVKQYAAYYMATWAPLHLANTTRERRQDILDRQVVPIIGAKRMCEVTPDDLAAMYAKLAATPAYKRNGKARGKDTLSGSTIATIDRAVRALFTFAYEIKEDIPSNQAARKAARPRVDTTPKPIAALSVEQVERIIAAVAEREPRYAVAVLLAAYLGTRRGETVGLRWSDVDFAAATITVRRSVSWTRADGLTVKSTKTGKHRTIPLDAHTLAELKHIRGEQRTERVRFGKGWRGAAKAAEDSIAAEPDGALMSPDGLAVTLQRVCRAAKVTSATMQQLRHSWVSQQIANGYDAVTIAAMSGHSPAVLLATYAHAFDSRKREAMDTMGKARKAARSAIQAV